MAVSRIDEAGLNVNQYGNRNLLINGDFQVSQRGDFTSATSVTNDTVYVDRWVHRISGVTATTQHIKGSNSSPNYPHTGSNSLKLAATSSASGVIRHLQRVEGFLKNRELTFSAWVKSNSSDARLFQYQQGTTSRVASSAHTGGGDWEKLSVTATNNATSDNNLYFDAAIASSSFGNVSITSGDYIEISEAQLEFGDTATEFEHRSFADELQRCLRYCFVTPTGQTYSWTALSGYCNSTSNALTFYQFPVVMRTAPSLSTSGSFQVADAHSTYDITSQSISDPTRYAARVDVAASGLTLGRVAMVRNKNDANATITFDAEF